MIGFALPAALGLGSAALGFLGSKNAASAASNAANQATAAQQAMYGQTREDLAPYRDAGARALPALERAIGTDFQTSPGYDFAVSEGINAIDRGASARGLLDSGARLKALTRYGTGMAQQDYGNWVSRLQGLAGMGQNAAAQTGAMGSSAANGIANSTMAGGQAQAQGITGGTNALLAGANQGLGLFNLMNPGFFK